jgi:L-rhamnose-H+ transport protein
MLGLGVCVLGISICGIAGMMKERSLTDAQKKAVIAEFYIRKGLVVAIFSGIMSACFSFGLTARQPIADVPIQQGADPLFMNNAILVILILGSLTINAIWTIYLNIEKTHVYRLPEHLDAHRAQHHLLRYGRVHLVLPTLFPRHGR